MNGRLERRAAMAMETAGDFWRPPGFVMRSAGIFPGAPVLQRIRRTGAQPGAESSRRPNLVSGPDELRGLAGDAGQAERIDWMKSRLGQW
ncbi:MAG: hypothetical protein EXS37_02630 [Opitutus sp.]|nr:hypothetical protein [Opitutus sp.]